MSKREFTSGQESVVLAIERGVSASCDDNGGQGRWV